MSLAENWQPQPTIPAVAAAPGAPGPELAPAGPLRKNPMLAGALSLFPGVGNVYNGLYMRGTTFFLVIVSLIAVASKGHDLFGFAVAFFWIFNVLDAWRQATLINYGYAQDLGLVDLPARPRAAQGGLAAGVLLVVVGLVAAIERYFHVSLDWLFELWPLALVGLGAWLVWGAIRDRRRERAASGPDAEPEI